MNQKTTKADMKLLEKGFVHPSNHTEVMYDIPLTFKLGEKTDMYLYSTVTKVKIETESKSSGGGGGGGSSRGGRGGSF